MYSSSEVRSVVVISQTVDSKVIESTEDDLEAIFPTLNLDFPLDDQRELIWHLTSSVEDWILLLNQGTIGVLTLVFTFF